MLNRTVWLAATSLILTTGCRGPGAAQYLAEMQGQPAPDFELTALDGSTVRLADYRGKPVVLAFWALG